MCVKYYLIKLIPTNNVKNTSKKCLSNNNFNWIPFSRVAINTDKMYNIVLFNNKYSKF